MFILTVIDYTGSN